jgi:HD-GYP domain-containing protein (c-di-GMP phosphodiesterase class II)
MQLTLRPQRSQAFFPVKTAVLRVFGDRRLSIYLRNAGANSYKLYRSAETSLKPSDFERLADAGVATVYIDAREYSQFQDDVRSNFSTILRDESLPVSQRFGVLNEVIRGVLRETFRWRNVSRAVEQANLLAEHLVDLIRRDDFVASELCAVLHYDYATFTHSTNVAHYCVLLAQALGHSDRDVLTCIGTGALLHDIGKIEIPDRLITKCGTLTSQELETVQRHASLGFVNLSQRSEVEFGQLMMVYQHHERLDGTGYPVRLEGNEIHDWARICAVADVFDALTSQRPYRRSLSTTAALQFMQCHAGAGLDPEVLRCWQMTIGKT